MTVAVGTSTIYDFVTKDKINSQSDLQLISGKLSHYSFTHGIRGSKEYYVWLTNFPNTFQIPADYIWYFKKQEFIKNALPHKDIKLKIAKSRAGELNKENKIFIFEIKIYNTIYLDSVLTIAKEKKQLPLYVGSTFILAGILFFIYRRKYAYRNHF